MAKNPQKKRVKLDQQLHPGRTFDIALYFNGLYALRVSGSKTVEEANPYKIFSEIFIYSFQLLIKRKRT